MNYEEKYKAALERAKKLYKEAKANEYTSDMEDYETIFPELAESEDESIRKEIIHFLEIEKGQMTPEQYSDCENWFAWLEKQKEQKAIA